MDDHGRFPMKSKSANAMEKSLADWRYLQASIFADDGFENEMRKSLWDEACQFYEKVAVLRESFAIWRSVTCRQING